MSKPRWLETEDERRERVRRQYEERAEREARERARARAAQLMPAFAALMKRRDELEAFVASDAALADLSAYARARSELAALPDLLDRFPEEVVRGYRPPAPPDTYGESPGRRISELERAIKYIEEHELPGLEARLNSPTLDELNRWGRQPAAPGRSPEPVERHRAHWREVIAGRRAEIERMRAEIAKLEAERARA